MRRIEDHDLRVQGGNAAHDVVYEIELHACQPHVGAETAARISDLDCGQLGVEAAMIVKNSEASRQFDMEASVG